MSSFSIANTYALRTNYSQNRTYAVKKSREDISSSTLSLADSIALKKSIRSLADFDFDDADEDDLASNIRAFVDTYNYTLSSASKTGLDQTAIKSIAKNMKSLTNDYKSELENLGVTINSSGYLSFSSSAAENIDGSKFESLFGSDSDYMKSLKGMATHITKKVDIYA